MKFRTRLWLSFLIIIFVPIILSVALLYGVYVVQNRGAETTADSNYNMLTDSVRLMSKYTADEYSSLKEKAEDDPQSVLDASYLQQLNDSLRDRFSYVVVMTQEEVVFDGSGENAEVPWDDLPAYGESGTIENSFVFIDDEYPTILRQVDVSVDDLGQFSIYLITTANATLPEVRALIGNFIVGAIAILLITALALVTWIYRGMMPEVDNLRHAAENIKEGNLEEPIKVNENSTDEFKELGYTFEEMRLHLLENTKEKLEGEKEQKQLISNIAHDLKTPITAIKGYAEGLLDGIASTPEKQEAYVKIIYSKANEMNTLINELSLYSKIDTNRIPYEFQHIPVKDYFMDCAEEIGMDLENQQIAMSYYNYVNDDVEIIADPEQLQRVIHNIIGNSVKYMGHDHGHINMRIKDVGDFIQVELEDNGKGIPAKDLPYIFDRTFRGDASRNSGTGGSGIGLSVVKKIVEDHGGKVWATSKVNVGTVVYFVLRKYKEETVDE